MTRVTNPFRCRTCNGLTRVLKTRGDGDYTLRERECERGHRFVTREVFDRDIQPRKETRPCR